MKNILLGAIAIGAMLTISAPAQAREGCGRDAHRGPHGRCIPNRGDWRPGPGREAWVEGRFYPGRGYWSRGRWWQHREHHHGGWRYR